MVSYNTFVICLLHDMFFEQVCLVSVNYRKIDFFFLSRDHCPVGVVFIGRPYVNHFFYLNDNNFGLTLTLLTECPR